jgi:hypothetical protein
MSGLVEASRKYGRPTVAPRRSRMRATGFSSPAGFQCSAGMMGSVASAAMSSTM